ncbi:MAG TPA: serine hydrolase [Chitinophagaceae bacterium]|nr:serine hydrolase [Chitinophagaceae bacterium]
MNKFFLLLLSLFQLNTSNAQVFNPLLANKLQYTLDSLYNYFSYNTKGVSVAVYSQGQGLWTGTAGLSHAGVPIHPQMKFGIASNSKLFTAITLLKLAERGIITLNDSISTWLPSYPNVNPNITIRQLLNHTSGLSDPFFTSSLLDSIVAHPTQVYTPASILALLGPPAYAPGTGYAYSNVNYILAGMIAKSATGREISALIRDSVLTPLQLDSIFYDIAEPVTGTLAHRWHDSTDFHTISRISLNTAGGPAGSLFARASDIVNWYQVLFNTSFLSQTSMNELTTFLMPGNYALGLQRITFFGKTTWGHGGSTIGYKSRTIYDPCMKAAVCGLSNSDQSAVDGITALLYKVLVDYLPACPGTITGPTTLCQGQQSVTYNIPPIALANSYEWILPTGVSGTSNSNSITLQISNTALSANLGVRGVNNYGVGATAILPLSIHPKPQVTVSASVNPLCSGTASTLYASGASTYGWQPGNMQGMQQMVSPIGNTTYTITGTSANGCSSSINYTLQVINGCSAPVYLKCFIEGYYNGNGQMQPVLQNQGVSNATGTLTDTLLVELHQSMAPFTLVGSAKAIWSTNGMATVSFPFTGIYYLAVKHRNGLQTWSAVPVTLGSTSLLYDFSTSATMAYGNNQMHLGNGVYGFYSGDVQQDENIDLLDLVLLEGGINNFLSGYVPTDLNGDGNTDLLDMPLAESNAASFIFAVHP